jgi:uncharacterized membrane-anchored protein
MCAFLTSYSGKGGFKILLLAVLVVFPIHSSRADKLSLMPSELSLSPMTPGDQNLGWVLGPAKVPLGDSAVIDLSDGYRFVDAKGARQLLQRMHNPVPAGIVGLLAPNSGKWWLVLEFTEVGYVRDLKKISELDAHEVIKAVQERINDQNNARAQAGLPPITSIEWASQPAYDAGHNTLEWAFRAGSQPTAVINRTVRLFGRKGFLDATAVQPDQAAGEAIPLGEIMKNVAFNPGQTYGDYQPGDKIAKTKLAELIAGESQSTDLNLLIKGAIWAGVILAAGGLAGVVVVLRRKYRSQKVSLEQPTGRDPGFAALFHNGNGSHNRNGARRRRAFNYQKYYSDMMLQVSSGPSALESVLHANGHGERPIRETNGWHPIPPAQGQEQPAVNQVIVQANLELIANQTNLIEEQKRLLQEQSRLIEEKSRLIREKNQLLEKQSELFERDLL